MSIIIIFGKLINPSCSRSDNIFNYIEAKLVYYIS